MAIAINNQSGIRERIFMEDPFFAKREKKGGKENECRMSHNELNTLKGYKYVSELRLNPGKLIDVTRLYCLDQPAAVKYIDEPDSDAIYVPEIDAYIQQGTDQLIEMTDDKTLSEIKKAVRAITYKLQIATENNDLAVAEDCKSQLEKFNDYVSKVTTPRGKIKYFADRTRRHQSSVYRAVQLYIKQLRFIDAAEADYIAKHVVIGRVCYWSVDPIDSQSILSA
jgi:hypothetical protein